MTLDLFFDLFYLLVICWKGNVEVVMFRGIGLCWCRLVSWIGMMVLGGGVPVGLGLLGLCRIMWGVRLLVVVRFGVPVLSGIFISVGMVLFRLFMLMLGLCSWVLLGALCWLVVIWVARAVYDRCLYGDCQISYILSLTSYLLLFITNILFI